VIAIFLVHWKRPEGTSVRKSIKWCTLGFATNQKHFLWWN
jgi:hypothetical protein